MFVRDASAAGDAAACAAIYAPYVRDTVITFELDPPSEAEMAARIERARKTHAWLVAEDGGRVVGYAYGSEYKSRAAYRYSCEVSVYVARDHHRGGVGRALYTELFDRLAARGFHMAVAGMTQPNEASAALHKKMGFELIGTYRRIGWKHDNWHDVTWAQRPLTTGTPRESRPQT
ncbi:MAG: N-acetyltransferase family protein [Actinomycetota bacterium]|nr:N-acetyltransferase family protein [Actinomycetota bacterium]